MSRTWHEVIDAERRIRYGEGEAPSEEALRLLSRARGARRQWNGAFRLCDPGVDQAEAEKLLQNLLLSGLIRIFERRNRRGDFEPYRFELTASGASSLSPAPECESLHEKVEDYLREQDRAAHPVLEAIRRSLMGWQRGARPATTLERSPMAVRLLLEIGDTLRRGSMPRGRLLAVGVGGHTKAVRIADYREELETAMECPLEDVVRLHGRAVYLYGALTFSVGPHRIDATFSRPWLALTPETLERMDQLSLTADTLLTIENLVAFEEEVRAGLPPNVVAVYTGGFPGGLERQLLTRLVASGVRRAFHWGDLDLGGLRILRDVQSLLPVPVVPFRMDEWLLERLPTQPLTEHDREGLNAWLRDEEAPLRSLAGAMLRLECKAEQEGWFLLQLDGSEIAGRKYRIDEGH